MGDHFDELIILAAMRCDVQIVAVEAHFIGCAALGMTVHHASGKGESGRAAGTVDYFVEELSHPDRAGDARAVLLQIEIRRAVGAVGQRITQSPVTAKLGGEARSGENET